VLGEGDPTQQGLWGLGEMSPRVISDMMRAMAGLESVEDLSSLIDWPVLAAHG
jgi:hypothetical protein